MSDKASAEWLERFGFKHVFMPEKVADSAQRRHEFSITPMIRLPKSTKNVQAKQLGSVLQESSKKINTNFPQTHETTESPLKNSSSRQHQLATLRLHTQQQQSPPSTSSSQPFETLKRYGSKSKSLKKPGSEKPQEF